MIFCKSPKTLFLGPFLPFLVIFARWAIFPKNPALWHITIYGSLTPCSKFEKKLMSQFWENLRTDGRTNGRVDPILCWESKKMECFLSVRFTAGKLFQIVYLEKNTTMPYLQYHHTWHYRKKWDDQYKK